MPLNTERDVESGAIVLEGDDRCHLNDRSRLVVLTESVHQCFVNSRWGRCRPLCVFESNPFRLAEGGNVAPCSSLDGANFSVADPILAAPGSMEILSERAAYDRSNPQVEQMAQSRWCQTGAAQPA